MKKNNGEGAAFEGYETFINNLRMSSKMYREIFVLYLSIQIIVFVCLFYFISSNIEKTYVEKLFLSNVYSVVKPNKKMIITFPEGKSFSVYPDKMRRVVWGRITDNWLRYYFMFLFSCLVWIGCPFTLKYFKKRSKEQSEKKWIKGSKLISFEEMNESINKAGEKVDLCFGQVCQPVNYETTHTFFGGTTGVGKTSFLLPVMERVIERGDRAIIYDNKGDFTPIFFNPERDFLFNPLDQRCCGWNVFNDIDSVMDIEAIAMSLIPPATGSDPYWNEAARDLFSGILQYCWDNNLKTNKDVWKLVSTDAPTLSEFMKSTPGAEAAYVAIQDGSSKQASSIISVMMCFAKAFKYMAAIDGDFSIKRHLKEGQGNIFVTNYEDVEATLRPIISLFIDSLGRSLLSLPINRERRIFFFLDELGTLQKLSTIVKMLTLSRDKGGACYLGVQDAGMLAQIYGEKGRETIVNCCNTTLFFRFNEPNSQQYVSRLFGETVFHQVKKSDSMGVDDNKDGKSLSYEEKTEPLIIASELKNLENLTGFVSFSGFYTAKVKFTYKKYQEKQEKMILFEHLSLKNIEKEQEKTIADLSTISTDLDVSWTGAKSNENGNIKPVKKAKLNRRIGGTKNKELRNEI